MELIDRNAVVKALDEAKIKTISEEYDRIIDVIGSMPTIEERKTGKWISDSAYHKTVILYESGNVSCSCHCSVCGDWLTGSDEYPCKGNYCPNCGAKMEGSETDVDSCIDTVGGGSD